MTGLSPRVRGNQPPERVPRLADGSIPASAGEPSSGIGFFSFLGVYPRECGGTAGYDQRAVPVEGLSPRVRGNRRRDAPRVPRRRSIPASAGEPSVTACSPSPHRVYPRECGGTRQDLRGFQRRAGLSPRVRGNRATGDGTDVGLGSIPASAGEPLSAQVGDDASRVYPRECGGTTTRSKVCLPEAGLSPRVRGNPRHGAGLFGPRGSIPASAGEPSRGPRGR